MQGISFIPLLVSEKMSEYFCEKLPFVPPWQPIKFSDLDKIYLKGRGMLNKYFCKKEIQNIPDETAEIPNFHFSHFKMETIVVIANTILTPLEQKHNLCRG